MSTKEQNLSSAKKNKSEVKLDPQIEKLKKEISKFMAKHRISRVGLYALVRELFPPKEKEKEQIGKIIKDIEYAQKPYEPNPQPILQGEGVKIVKKYFKGRGTVKCKYCGRRVDTIIFTASKVGVVCRCPFCQNLNWLDLISTVGKTAEGHKQTIALPCHIKDPKHKENNMIVKGPILNPFKWLLYWLSFKRIRPKKPFLRFGYVKIYGSPSYLQNAKEFDKKYFVAIGMTPKNLISKYFGDVQMTVTKQVEETKMSK